MFFPGKSFKRVLAGLLSLGLLLGAGGCSEPSGGSPGAPSGGASGTERDGTGGGNRTKTNSIGMEFVRIPAGTFMMGSADDDKEANTNEKPSHRVTISQPFSLGKYEVTQAQWEAVMGNNPSKYKGRDNPVERVSWEDVQRFINKLNQKEGTDKYRLPTEAEWEYAARAGTTTTYSFGNDKGDLGRYAWYRESSGGGTHRPVGQKEPNPWGLYDMHGNVWEWVSDGYHKEYYAHTLETDPMGFTNGEYRVLRGGCWYNPAKELRSARRGYLPPDNRRSFHGFRLARSPDQP